jgi:hypothetical protein
MRYSSGSTIHVIKVVLTLTGVCASAAAQNETARFDELKAQYKLVKVGLMGGNKAREDPTALVVQKEGIFGVGVHGTANPTATYVDGMLRSPGKTSGLLSLSDHSRTHWFQVNEKVYPSKFEINLKADRITVFVVTSDYAFKGGVHFQFPRGTLATADIAQIQAMIGQVLAFDNGGNNSQQAQDQAPPAQDAGVNQPPAAQEQAPQPQAPPQTIRLGQTPGEVLAILGQPQKIANLDSKMIYVYKDLKVTFVDGKVSDVQ